MPFTSSCIGMKKLTSSELASSHIRDHAKRSVEPFTSESVEFVQLFRIKGLFLRGFDIKID